MDGPGSCAGDYTPAGAPPRPGARILTLGVPPTRASRRYRGFPSTGGRSPPSSRTPVPTAWTRFCSGSHCRQFSRTHPSCHRFRANEVRLLLGVTVDNLRNPLRWLVLRVAIQSWSLTGLQQRLSCKGARPRWPCDGHGASVRGRRRPLSRLRAHQTGLLQGRVITSTSAGRPSSLTTRRARRRAGPTASAVSIGPSAQTPKP